MEKEKKKGKTTEYLISKKLNDVLEDALKSSNAFLPIIDHVKIAACFLAKKEDGNPAPSKAEPVVLKKVPPAMRVFMQNDPHYVLVVDNYWWDEAERDKPGSRQQLLSRALSCIEVETTEDKVVISSKKWDIQENYFMVETYGAYTKGLSLVKDLFTRQSSMRLSGASAVADNLAKAPVETRRTSPKPAPITRASNNDNDDDDSSSEEPIPAVKSSAKPAPVTAKPLARPSAKLARPSAKAAPEEQDEDQQPQEEQPQEEQPERTRPARVLPPAKPKSDNNYNEDEEQVPE